MNLEIPSALFLCSIVSYKFHIRGRNSDVTGAASWGRECVTLNKNIKNIECKLTLISDDVVKLIDHKPNENIAIYLIDKHSTIY